MTDKQRVQGDQFVLINKVDAKTEMLNQVTKLKFLMKEVLLMLSQKCSNDVSPGIVVVISLLETVK